MARIRILIKKNINNLTKKIFLPKNAYRDKNSRNIQITTIYSILKKRKELNISQRVNSQEKVRPIRLKGASR